MRLDVNQRKKATEGRGRNGNGGQKKKKRKVVFHMQNYDPTLQQTPSTHLQHVGIGHHIVTFCRPRDHLGGFLRL